MGIQGKEGVDELDKQAAKNEVKAIPYHQERPMSNLKAHSP